MARQRDFNKALVLEQCTQLFITYGYEGTSISDLVTTTGILRGSLYAAFGSKLGIFQEILQQLPNDHSLTHPQLDLLIVALNEVAPHNPAIKDFLIDYVANFDTKTLSHQIGQRIMGRLTHPS